MRDAVGGVGVVGGGGGVGVGVGCRGRGRGGYERLGLFISFFL